MSRLEKKHSNISMKHTMKLTDLSDDILFQIYTFIPSIQDLRNFAFVNKRASAWMFQSKATNALFGTAYLAGFGEKRSGRKAWKELAMIRQCLSKGVDPTLDSSKRHSVGLLSSKQETEAIGYDHSRHFRDGEHCLGYFGMKRLFLHENGPLLIWGDFDGAYVVPSMNDLGRMSPKARATASFHHIQGDSQVLSVVASPLSFDKETNSTTCFLGSASGSVQAIRVVKEGERLSYEIISTAVSHTDEVTSLTVLPLVMERPCLASSSVDGTIILYPESFSKNPTLESATLMYRTRDPPVSILCFASWQRLICTGNDSGRLALWLPDRDFIPNDPCWTERSSMLVEAGGSLPTLMQSHHSSNILVVGTNSGGLFTFRVSTTHEVLLIPLHSAQNAHTGAVESIEIVGNILLTSSAQESHLMGWDIRTLTPIGSIAVHPGRLYQSHQGGRSQVSLKCAVMSTIVCHERKSLLCLCRDGTVREFSYLSAASASLLDSPEDIAPKPIASLQAIPTKSPTNGLTTNVQNGPSTPKQSWEQSIKALMESNTAVTEGDKPGSIKVWECKLCLHLNHWRLYTCSSCGRRSGGKAWDLSWPTTIASLVGVHELPTASSSSEICRNTHSNASPSSSSATVSHRKRKLHTVWDIPGEGSCHSCGMRSRRSAWCHCCGARK